MDSRIIVDKDIVDENDPIAAIEACQSRLGYFHIGESHRGYLGTGNITLRNMFRALARVGYSGPLVFESFSNAIVSPFVTEALAIWRNQWEDGEQVAKHALDYIQSEWFAAQQSKSTPLLFHFRGQ